MSLKKLKSLIEFSPENGELGQIKKKKESKIAINEIKKKNRIFLILIYAILTGLL